MVMLRPIRIQCVGVLISTGLICIYSYSLPYERFNSIKYRNTSRIENHVQMKCNKIDHQIVIYVYIIKRKEKRGKTKT